MTEETKRRGRPSKWGTGNSNKAAIAADLQAAANGDSSVTMYYVTKMIDMGLLEINLTEKGKEFIAENA